MTRTLNHFLAVFILIFLIGSPVLAQEDLIGGEADMEAGAEAAAGPIEEYTSGMTSTEGLFSYYIDEETHRVLVSMYPEQLGHEFIVALGLTEGTGGRGFSAPMMSYSYEFRVERDGMSVEVIEPFSVISTVPGEPMARAVDQGISDVYLGRVPIEVEDEEDGRIVFDFSTMLLLLAGFDPMSMTYGYSYWADYEGTYIDNIRAFPQNDEIDARVIMWGADDALGNTSYAGQEINMHFSLIEPPGDGFTTRVSDDRVGYFLSMNINYSVETDSADTRYRRYIQRWRLEKADPTAEISEPVEPITFWIANNVPVEYRDAVRDGILAWNIAFEQAGFRNAMRVRQMPDDADWDPADVRYNVVQWMVAPTSNFAIGPSNAYNATGELFAADISVNADMMRGPYRELEFTVDPISDLASLIAPPVDPGSGFHQVRWDENTLAILEERMNPGGEGREVDWFPLVHATEAARAALVLQQRGQLEPGSPEEDRFIYEYIVALVMHEVGHTLGLRHNYTGSAATPYYKLQQAYWTRQHGLSSSIMDYTIANIAGPGELQGEYFQTVPGDYDVWAIRYGYTEFNTDSEEEELEALRAIADESGMYRYATDEDASMWSRNMDPDCYLWDLSDDPVRWHDGNCDTADEMIDGLMAHWGNEGTRPYMVRYAFMYAAYSYYQAAAQVPRAIGGVREYRDHIGTPDSHPSMVPLSAEEQRFALQWLVDNIWLTDRFDFDPALLNSMGRQYERTFDWLASVSGLRDYDVHDLVLRVQGEPFYWLYDSLVLQRILNNEVRMPDGGEAFTMTELFDTVRNAVWTELSTGSSIDSYRRNLQRAHLDMITGIVLNPANGTPEDAITLARHDLLVIKGQIESIMGANDLMVDTMTLAHLDECLATIELTLEAPMNRGGSGGSIILSF